MAKMTIKEDRLQELIQESVYEVLEEWKWLNNIADKAGRAYQGIRTGLRQAARSFNAGRSYVRDKHKDFNEYGRYGDKEDDLRRMAFNGYGDYRYNLETERNKRARGENADSTQSQETVNVQPHPNLQQNTQGGDTQPQLHTMPFNDVITYLKSNGIEPEFKDNFIVRYNGVKTPEQRKLVQQAKRNPKISARQRLYEHAISNAVDEAIKNILK